MTLDQYLDWAELSNDAFAALLSTHIGREVHRVTIGQYRRRQRVPQADFMVAIYVVTRGIVDPNSFYDLPDLAPSQPAASDPRQIDLVELVEKGEAA